MGRALGIIGGGQLGMMLAEAAAGMDEVSGVTVLDPTEGCPASRAGAEQITAGFGDADAIGRLADRCDVITYEIESGDCDALDAVAGRAEVSPPPSTLRAIQDKLAQKEMLRDGGAPVGDFARVGGQADLEEAMRRFGSPAVLKARRGGYDGRGNYALGGPGDAAAAMAHFGGRPVYVEKAVDFEMEVSVIAARGAAGRAVTFPTVENLHEGGILRTTVAPARLGIDGAAAAARAARGVMGLVKGRGVFGIEMFVERGGGLLVNEIAPRVHNSGHHTLQSSETSQFEQHVRAVMGLELGEPRLLKPAVMRNILGPEGFSGPYAPIEVKGEGVDLKMYGKREARPGRKMGHFTVTDGARGDVGALLERADGLSAAIRFRPPGP